MDVLTSRRIVLLGKTGAGKSSLANTILGENVFKISHAPTSEESLTCSETKHVNGKIITLIDTQSFFDTCGSEELLNPEILRCITECAPGPHAFLIVLKVEKFTKQEKEVIKHICRNFSDDALKYAAVVFTHGDQLSEGMKIDEFVSQNEGLRDLVKKCGGRCHVVDNKYWKDNKEDDYRSNQFQVLQILNTVDKITDANKGGYYTNEMLQAVKTEIQREEENIKQSPGNMSQKEIRQKATDSVYKNLGIKLVGATTGALLGAFLGVDDNVSVVTAVIRGVKIGFDAAKGATSPTEAAQRAAHAMWNSTSFSSRTGPASN